MTRALRKLLFLTVLIRLGFVAGSCGAIDIQWVAPTTDLWNSPSAWNLGIVPQNDTPTGVNYDVLINAEGSSYFVRSDSDVTVDSVLLDSDNATLRIEGGVFTANDGITISAGNLRLTGGEIADTRIESSSSNPITITGNSAVFNNITLAADVTGNGSVFSYARMSLKDRLTLEGGSLRAAADLLVQAEGNITFDGTGQIIVGPNRLDSGSTSRTGFLEFTGAGARPVIGAGVTIRGMGRGSIYGADTNVVLTNEGTIAADMPDVFLVVERTVNLVNNGQLTASNGGRLFIDYGATPANVGQTAILAGGTLELAGPNYTIDQAIHVPTDATLELYGNPTNSAGIALAGGTLRFASAVTDTTNINYLSGEVQVGADLPLAYFASLNLPSQIAISFEPGFNGIHTLDLAGNAYDISAVHANWKFDGGRFANGTLTGAPAPGHLTPNGDTVFLEDIHIDFDLGIDSGTVSLEDNTTIAANRTVTVGSGGTLYLKSWSSEGTIAVHGGKLQLISFPNSPGQIDIASGTLEIGTTLTASQLMQISTTDDTQIQLISGQPSYSWTHKGGVDLEGASVDLSLVTGSWNYDQGTIVNGTLTGATDLGSLGADNRTVTLRNVNLAFPLSITQGMVVLANDSTVASPLHIDGGALLLDDNWTNNSSITVENGILSLMTLPQDLGTIEMNGGTLDLQFNTSLSQVNQLEVGNPDTIRISRTVNLEGGTLDLGNASAAWELYSGRLNNGTIIDSSGVNPLVVTYFFGSNLDNIVIEADIETAGELTVYNSSARNVTFNGTGSVEFYSDFSNPTRLESTSFNAVLKFRGNLEIVGGLTLNGGAMMAFPSQRPNVHFLGTQSIEGNSEILVDGARGPVSSIVFSVDDTLTLRPGIKFHVVESPLSEITGPGGTLVNEGLIETELLLPGFATTNLRIALAGLENTGAIRAKNSGQLLIEVDDWTNQGQLEVDGSTIFLAGTEFRNGADGVIQGNGEISLDGPVLINHGEISPGFSAGSLLIDGDLQHETDGIVRLELGGDVPGAQYDRLAVSGDVHLAGQLQIELIDGFTLQESDVFEILDVGGILTGSFAGLQQDDLVGQFNGVNLYIRYDWGDGNDVALYTEPVGLAGDFDNDGDVDGRDFLAWQRGESPRPLGAGNLALWKQNYGAAGAQISSTAPIAVPEPNAWAMLLVALAARGLAVPQRAKK